MKKQTLYVCEYCNTQYAKQEDALTCEKTHNGKFNIASMKFIPYKQDSSGFPVRIVLINEKSGKTVEYKR